MHAVTTEQEQIRELARQFAQGELRPHVEEWDKAAALDSAILAQLGELGFFGMLVSEADGGMDFDLPTYLAAVEELSWGEAGIGLTLSIHSAMTAMLGRYGTDAQKDRWLASLASGERIGAFALSEAGAGSDAAAVAVTAEKESDGWVLRGRKKWVTNARVAGLAAVVARTGGEGHEGLSMFLVPTDADGWTPGRREDTMGLRCLEVMEVELDVRVPADALLGEEGAGFRLAMEGLDMGRLGVAAQALGIAQAALDHARRYAGEREQFGRALQELQAIQFKLADMATRVAAARSLLMWAATEGSTEASAMAKLFCSRTAMAVSTEAVQIFGGYGYMRDYPVEKLMRDAKATEIYEGTNEIQRVVIARELFRRG